MKRDIQKNVGEDEVQETSIDTNTHPPQGFKIDCHALRLPFPSPTSGLDSNSIISITTTIILRLLKHSTIFGVLIATAISVAVPTSLKLTLANEKPATAVPTPITEVVASAVREKTST